MPHGYYQFVRLSGTFIFILLAYESRAIKLEMIFWIFCSLLLNPIIKVHFSKTIWNVIDIILALIIILSIFFNRNTIEGKKNGN